MRVNPGEPAFSMPIRLEIASRVVAAMLADKNACFVLPDGRPATTMEESAWLAAGVALAYADALIAAHNGESQ